ncbi:MAG TPA: hypothetical protein VIG33_01070 [Pseudobdellovibrionaceae bacterium]|jgi:hypothetical protein
MRFSRFWMVVSTALFTSFIASAQTAGTNILEVSPGSEAPSKWGVSFYSLGSIAQKQIETGDPSYFTYNYIGLNYKISKSRRFAIRPVFNYVSSGKDKYANDVKSEMTTGDLHIVYADYEIATLGEANVSTSFKFYLPTSQGSQDSQMIVKFRPETFISMEVRRHDILTYALKPDFFLQSRGSYLDANRKDRSTQIALIEHYLEYSAGLNKMFSLKPSVGFIESWFNPSTNKNFNTHKTEAKIALGLDINLMKGLMFTLSAENRVLLTDRKDAVTFFRPEDNGLVLITSASLL